MKHFNKYIKPMAALALLTGIMAVALPMQASTESGETITNNDPVIIGEGSELTVFSTRVDLTVNIDGEFSGKYSDTYTFDSDIDITAPETSSGKSFSYWEAEGNILSYNRNIKLSLTANTTLNAVYGKTVSESDRSAPTVGFTSVNKDDYDNILFNAMTTADPVTEVGVYYSTVAETKEALLSDGIKEIGTVDRNNCWTLMLKPEDKNEIYYAIPYVTDGTATYYGKVKNVQLCSLDYATSAILDLDEIDGFDFEGIDLSDIAVAQITNAPTGKKLTYNENEQPLVTAGTADGGTVQYKLGEDGTYSTSIPTAKESGNYKVYYKVVGDGEHFDSVENSVDVTIAKAEPEVSVTLNKEKVTVLDVITENDFTVEKNVNGKMEWTGLGGKLSEGEVSFAWTFTPDDTNYLPASGTVAVNVELPKIEGVQYNVAYDLSEYDFEHIRGISIEFSGQADYTTSGSAVLGNYAFSTALNSNTVSGNNIYIAIDQYSLQSAPDTLTIYDWYNTEATLGDITVTFYYMEDEEVEIADSSDILYNADNAIADQFDLSEYDHENVKSVTLVFDGVVYSGYGAITVDENGGFPYNFSMNRSKGNSITIDINGTMSDTLTFFNHYNLRNINYIALNY